jgi:predicted nucleic acid-binding protein
MTEKSNSIAIDTGILLELFGKTPLGLKFKHEILLNPIYHEFVISPLTVMELLYILGRKVGFTQAKTILDDFLVSPFLIPDEKVLREDAAKLKINFGIALADCYSLAIGIVHHIPVFMKKEKEISKILKKINNSVVLQIFDEI